MHSKLETGLWLGCWIFLLFVPTQAVEKKITSPISFSPTEQLLGDALINGTLATWDNVEDQAKTIEHAERLVRNFSLREEFSAEGRLIGRERIDGTRELIKYDNPHNRISVWVTSPDGKFKEERIYVFNLLRAVIYVDGSLKTLQYIRPPLLTTSQTKLSAEPAVCVTNFTASKVQILYFDSNRKFINGFLPDGTLVMKQSQYAAEDLSRMMNIDELQFFLK